MCAMSRQRDAVVKVTRGRTRQTLVQMCERAPRTAIETTVSLSKTRSASPADLQKETSPSHRHVRCISATRAARLSRDRTTRLAGCYTAFEPSLGSPAPRARQLEALGADMRRRRSQ